MPFDPRAPLPGAPDPWTGSSMPASDGPPFLMEQMIAAEPGLADRLVSRLGADPVAARLAEAIRAATRVVVTGCGTSLHAAEAIAEMLIETGVDGRPVQALEIVRRDPGADLVLAISHEGGTWATNEALRAANSRGQGTALVTVSDRSPAAALAGTVVTTAEQDQSWCHTVGYLSPLVVGAWIAARLTGADIPPSVLASWVDGGLRPAVATFRGCDRLLVVGAGVDCASARELALKVEEGARLPATALHLETVRHGHLTAATQRTGLVIIRSAAGAPDGPLRDRSDAVIRAGAALRMPTLVIEPVGNPPAGLLPSAAAALGVAIPLQWLALDLATARGMNPDTLGREDPRQAAAAEA